jgi:nitroreductase
MKITFNDIKKRKSIRTYDDRLLDPATKEAFASFIRSNNAGPFGTKIRFEIIDLTEAGQEELKQLASYGNIKGPKYFIAGVIKSAPIPVLDYGYLMEKNILVATSLGLGTCWIGGTFYRAGFLEKINAKANEVVPAIVSLGYAAKNKDAADTATRVFVSADSRKPWKDMFFDSNPDNPLAENKTGDLKIPLEALRLAPSASNKQPWRLVKAGEKLHIFLERTPGYSKPPREDIQLMYIGIAMCNFDIAAEEQGIKGEWKLDLTFDSGSRIPDSGLQKEGWESTAIWHYSTKP